MSEDNESIDYLIARFQAGIDRDREAAFRDLFQRFHSPVRRFFERKGCSEDESRDLTQETFLRVFRTLDIFRRNSRFETWLFSVMMNVYHNERRRRLTQKRYAIEVSLDSWEPEKEPLMEMASLEAEAGASPLERIIEKERSEALRLAIQELPDQMRMCCVLRIRSDMNYKEIAQVLGLSIDTVKAHLHQAKKRLRVQLGDSEELFDRL